jgi:hypothetical protein
MDLILKTGDTAATQRVQLVGRDGPAQLVGATVTMQVEDRPDVAFPVEVVDAAEGIVRVARGDLAPDGRRVRRFMVEFQVTFADGTVQTFPEDGYQRLTVWSDLDAR